MFTSLQTGSRLCYLAGLWLVMSLLSTQSAFAQAVNPEALGGTIRCITKADTLYEVKVDVKSPAACPFTSFTITWDALNRSAGEPHTGPGTVSHTYRLTDFINRCGSGSDDGERLIKVVTDCSNDNKSFSIFFKLRPIAGFSTGDACENSTTRFINETCPSSSDMKYRWDFGDGTFSTSPSPSKTYSNTATSYTATLSTTNVCGTDTRTLTIPIKKKPTANIKAIGFDALDGTETVSCLSNGAKLTLDATTSIDGSRYQWSISPATYRFIENTSASSPMAKIQFTQAGKYTITLIARNDCGESLPVTCPHRVEEQPNVQITPQTDACESISYSLKTNTPTAVFTLNGQPLTPNTPQSLSVSETPYIVRGQLAGQCGTRVVADTFLIQTPQSVSILSGRRLAICQGSSAVALPVSLTGGDWDGSGKSFVIKRGSEAFFNPTTLGTYEVVYARGSGVCRRTDAVQVEVQGGRVTAQSQTVCARTSFVKLQADQAGGIWSSSTNPGAVRNDTLFLTTVTGSTVSVSYSLNIGSANCPATSNATVTVGRPRAAFSISGVCSNTAPVITNTSLGSTAYRWSLNGTVISSNTVPSLTLPAGQNVLSLTAGSGSCTDTVSRTIRLLAAPAAVSFTPDKTAGCSPLPVQFNVPGAANSDVQYRWDYGNGITSSTFASTPQTYRNTTRQAQSVRVSLTAQNVCGVQSFSASLTVRPLAKAEIGVDSTTFRCSPARVKFANRSTGQNQPATWLWNDSSGPLTTTADTLSHLFSTRDSARTFRVQLIVSSDCGRDSDVVAIRMYPPTVKPLFTLGNARPCNGELVQLTDASVPKPERWFWRFGDGQTSTLDSPQHAFPEANKSYTITLIAYTACGYDSLRRTITTQAAPTGSLSVVAPFSCVGAPLTIRNSSDPRYRFVWAFGDGSPADSVQFSPSHTYASAGTFAGSLTLFGATRACRTTLPFQAVVRPTPVSAFSLVGPAEACSPATLQLVAAGEGYAWQWRLSDGQQLAGKQPTISLRSGTFDVSLRASYDGACPDSTTQRAAFKALDCQLRVPDAFSPNGYNPRWTVFGEGIDLLKVLRVWSRWGEVVFEARDIPAGSLQAAESWDGTFKGVPMPAGLYTYEAEVDFKGGGQERKVGSIRLMR